MSDFCRKILCRNMNQAPRYLVKDLNVDYCQLLQNEMGNIPEIGEDFGGNRENYAIIGKWARIT